MIFQDKIKHAFTRNSIRTYTLGIIKPGMNLNVAVAAFPLCGLVRISGITVSLVVIRNVSYSDDDVWSPWKLRDQ